MRRELRKRTFRTRRSGPFCIRSAAGKAGKLLTKIHLKPLSEVMYGLHMPGSAGWILVCSLDGCQVATQRFQALRASAAVPKLHLHATCIADRTAGPAHRECSIGITVTCRAAWL